MNNGTQIIEPLKGGQIPIGACYKLPFLSLFHGDCLNVMPTIEKARLLMTDIPYEEVNRDSNGLRKLDKETADVSTFKISDFLQIIYEKADVFIIFCGNEQY